MRSACSSDRAARAPLRQALADAYAGSARYLERAVEFGMLCCDSRAAAVDAPTDEATRAAAASRRLDDAFRSFLADRGAKPVALAEVTSLVTGAAALRLTADAVLDLWHRDDHQVEGDRTAARAELRWTSALMRGWYGDLATSLADRHEVPVPLERDEGADGRFIAAVRHDVLDRDGDAHATAVRMLWTGDHLDAARRLQRVLIEPARAITDHDALSPLAGIRPWRAGHRRGPPPERGPRRA